MPIHDQGMKDAVWLLLEITSQQQPGQIIHSDFVVRKFPKVDEDEIVKAIALLAKDGKVTLKPASVDGTGKATSYHIRVSGYDDQPAQHATEPVAQAVAASASSRIPLAQSVPMGTGRIVSNTAQSDAEQQFKEQVASFFAELASAPVAQEEDKRDLIDQLAVLMAMFQSGDTESFTTPMAKLATLKAKVVRVAPELGPGYLNLVQAAVRAWLGRA